MTRIKIYFPVVPLMVALIVFCGLARGADLAPKQKIKVFLLAGQSNMDGYADGGQLIAQDETRLAQARKHIRLAYNHHPIAPLNVTIPSVSIAEDYKLERTFGPELFFGLELSTAWPEENILLIKRSKGGSSLYGRWNPDWSVEKASVMNEAEKTMLYVDFVDYIREVLSEYAPGDYELCAMLWVQGEQDSSDSTYGPEPAESYGSNLKNLIHAIRRDTGVEDLPFIMLQVGSGKVVEGMKHVAATMENVFLITQDKDPESPDYLPTYAPPLGHYNYEGMKRIGEKFADVFLREYAKKK